MQISKIGQIPSFNGRIILTNSNYEQIKLEAKDIKEIKQKNYPEFSNTTYIKDKNKNEYSVQDYTLSDVLLAYNTVNIHDIDIEL